MGWRIVVINKNAKLDYKLNCLTVRQEKITKIHLSEISVLLIESTAVSITAGLISELIKNKIKVIFCDEKRNPSCELLPYYGCHDTSLKYRKQLEWSESIKNLVWTEIVSEKIRNQKRFLEELGLKEYRLLDDYILEIKFGDETNREGHAAKVYFNAIFGKDFTRTAENSINAALNYGYSIILSTVNREIVLNGYMTQLGLFHDNMFNQFNLASDLMEPFRILVNLLNKEVKIGGKINYVINAIKLYTKSVFDALNENDTSLIKFYSDEL